MDKELLKRLNEIRKELDISKEDFVNVLLKISNYQKECIMHISDEQLYLLIENILFTVDNIEVENKGFKSLKKTINQTIKKGIDCFDRKK